MRHLSFSSLRARLILLVLIAKNLPSKYNNPILYIEVKTRLSPSNRFLQPDHKSDFDEKIRPDPNEPKGDRVRWLQTHYLEGLGQCSIPLSLTQKNPNQCKDQDLM